MSTHLVRPTASMLRRCAKRCHQLAEAARSPEHAKELRRLERKFKAEIARLKKGARLNEHRALRPA